MKRTAVSVVAAIMVVYAIYGFGPNAVQETLSIRTIAQEPATPTGHPDPFSDPSDSPRKTTPPEPTAPKKGDRPRENVPPNPAKPGDVRVSAPDNPNDAIEHKLSQPDNFEFPDVSLQDLVDVLNTKLGIPFVIDKKGLEDAGVGTDKVVNVSLRGVRTDRCLDLILDELELAWVTRDGYVLITSKEKLGSLLEVRVYNCSDLIEMVKKTPSSKETPAPKGGFGGFFAVGQVPAGVDPDRATIPGPGGAPGLPTAPGAVPGGTGLPGVRGAMSGMPPMGHLGGGVGNASEELVSDFDSLIDVIQSTVETDSWADVGGYGSIESYHGGLLIISQNGQSHRRVEILLNMMRQAKQAPPGAVIRER